MFRTFVVLLLSAPIVAVAARAVVPWVQARTSGQARHALDVAAFALTRLRRGFPSRATWRRWVGGTVVAVILAYGALLVGLWAEFGGEGLGNLGPATAQGVATVKRAWVEDAFTPIREAPVNGVATSFWLLITVFGFVLTVRLRHDESEVERRATTVLQAIHRSPNLTLFGQLPGLYDNYQRHVYDQGQALIAQIHDHGAPGPPNQDPATTIETLGGTIRGGVVLIVGLAKEFARADERKARYGGNVMLLTDKTGADGDFDPNVVEHLRFHRKTDTRALKHVLLSPPKLLVTDVDEASPSQTRQVLAIALPVPASLKDGSGRLLAIPGAPVAVLDPHYMNVQRDTREIADACGDLAREIQDEIRAYFAPDGDGAEVRSFASFRLGTLDNPIGIVNIDTDQIGVLGESDEFYPTFLALVTPLLLQLAPLVDAYREHTRIAAGTGIGRGQIPPGD